MYSTKGIVDIRTAVIWVIVMIRYHFLEIVQSWCIVCRVMTAVLLSTVVLQCADLAVAVAVADVIITPGMIAVDHVPLAVATDTVTTDAVIAATDAHGGTAGTEAATDVVLLVGHRQKQRASKSS